MLNRRFWPAGKTVLLTLGLNTRVPPFKIPGLPAGRVLPAGYAVRVEVVKTGLCVLVLVVRASTWPPQTYSLLAEVAAKWAGSSKSAISQLTLRV